MPAAQRWGGASNLDMCAAGPSYTREKQQSAPARAPGAGRGHGILLGAVALGAILGALIFSAFTHTARSGFSNRLAGILTGRDLRIDSSSPAIVERIRQLSRLETVDYSIDKIVEGDRSNRYLPNFLVGDKLLLVAHGDVVAGVDLSQLTGSDVFAQGQTVPADPNLESQVRQEAEQQFIEAALAGGILDKARQNARTSVSALLRAVGFREVDVE